MEEQKKEKWQTNTSLRLQFGLSIDYLVLLQIKSNQSLSDYRHRSKSLSLLLCFFLNFFYSNSQSLWFFFSHIFFGLFCFLSRILTTFPHPILPHISPHLHKKPKAILNALKRKTLQVDSGRNRAELHFPVDCFAWSRADIKCTLEEKK